MPSSFSLFCVNMSKAAKVLTKSKSSTEDVSKALMTLGSGFSDVSLPEEPLSLSSAEAESISLSAAKELKVLFDSTARDFIKTNPSPPEFAAFALATDPLWREISAANWNVVSKQESFRLDVALQGVTMVSSQIQSANNFSPDQTIGFLQDAFTNVANPMHFVLRNMFAAQGVGVHHALKALSLLSE